MSTKPFVQKNISLAVKERLPASQRATDGLRTLLRDGSLAAGDNLPSEQCLADRFSVSRGTVRKALLRIEEEGLIRRRKHCGYIVQAAVNSNGSVMQDTVALITTLSSQPQQRLFSGTEDSVESGIQDRLSEAKCNLLLLHARHAHEQGILQLVKNPPRGVIISCRLHHPEQDKHIVSLLQTCGVPVAVRSNAPAFAECDRVYSDHAQGTADLVRHLAAQGHKRILRLWTQPESVYWIRDHNEGYETAVASCGVPSLAPCYVEGLEKRVPYDAAVFERRTRYLAGCLVEYLNGSDPVDAIMVSTDCEIFPVAAACRLFGKTPGRDVAITGYDNYWQNDPDRAFETATPLATIEKDNHALGEAMAQLLQERAAGTLPSAPQARRFAQRIVVPNTQL